MKQLRFCCSSATAQFAIAAVKIPFQLESGKSGRRKGGFASLLVSYNASPRLKKSGGALLLRPLSSHYAALTLRAAQITRSSVIPAAVPLALACGARAGEKLLSSLAPRRATGAAALTP